MEENNIIELNTQIEENEENEKFDFASVFFDDAGISLGDFGDDDIMNVLMEMPDDEFEIISEQILQEFEKAIRNPEDRVFIQETLEQIGIDAETLINESDTMIENIDSIDEKAISKPKKDFFKRVIMLQTNAMMSILNEAVKIVSIPLELGSNAKAPQYAHIGDGAMDVYAVGDYTVNPGETVLVKTGIKTAIPDGYALLIQPRSGQSLKTKLRVANTPGLIDGGYRDEIGVIIENIESPIENIEYSTDDDGNITITSITHGKPYYIEDGQRIAQMRLVAVPTINWVRVDNILEIGGNRGGGFGHSGNF